MSTLSSTIQNKTSLKILYNLLDISIDIISIEGNIGSGKSTLCNMVKKYFSTFKSHQSSNINYHFIDEPVEEWEKIRDETQENKNMLELFYEDQDRYSFVFQTTAYITRIQYIKNRIDAIIKDRMADIEKIRCNNIPFNHVKHIIILERSIQTDRNVFAKMLYNDKKINEIQWRSYNYWFDNFVGDFGMEKIIYVRAEPSLSYERTKKRNRNGEESIPLDYLKKCHHYHETWINDIENANKMLFDASKNINEDKDIDLDYITPIIEYITSIC